MTLATTLYIGPITASARNLEVTWKSAPSPQNTRAAGINVTIPIAQAEQLSEMVANRDMRITIGAETGVLVSFHADTRIVAAFNGWYLLQGVSYDPYGTGDWVSHVPVSISAVNLGQRQPRVTRSSRDLANDFDLDAKSMVADPFYGGSFVVSPGGTLVTREYDRSRWTPDSEGVSADMDIYIVPTASVIPCAPRN